MVQTILVILLTAAAVFFVIRHLVKEYKGKHCEDCVLRQPEQPERPIPGK